MSGEGAMETREQPAPVGPLPEDRSLLIVDDDRPFLDRLARAMTRRGFEVTTATTLADALAATERAPPRFAVIDLVLGDGYGLDIVPALRERQPGMRIVVLTSYGNITSAIAAIKVGAVDYLAKPADADAVTAALLATGPPKPPPGEPMSAARMRWRFIQQVFELCDGNISETARRLSLHRRTLQRILARNARR